MNTHSSNSLLPKPLDRFPMVFPRMDSRPPCCRAQRTRLHVPVLVLRKAMGEEPGVARHLETCRFNGGISWDFRLGKCPILGMLTITFKYSLEIISQIFGWCSSRTFTNPCMMVCWDIPYVLHVILPCLGERGIVYWYGIVLLWHWLRWYTRIFMWYTGDTFG